jgi:hypothetical protein
MNRCEVRPDYGLALRVMQVFLHISRSFLYFLAGKELVEGVWGVLGLE